MKAFSIDPKPKAEDYGWQGATSFDEESGWMVEHGEEQYYLALKAWEKRQAELAQKENTNS